MPRRFTSVPVVASRGTTTRFAWQARGSALVTIHREGTELLQVQLRSSQPTLDFAPGRYSIEVTADGMRGAAAFVVGDTPGATVDVVLAN